MIFVITFIVALILYVLVSHGYRHGKENHVAISTTLLVTITILMALYVEHLKFQNEKLVSPCPEYELVNIKYYKLKE